METHKSHFHFKADELIELQGEMMTYEDMINELARELALVRDSMRTIRKPHTRDDLQSIYGIGPALEKKLHDFGIKTFEDLAHITTKQLEAIQSEIPFSSRVSRDAWIEQAQEKLDSQVSQQDSESRNKVG